MVDANHRLYEAELQELVEHEEQPNIMIDTERHAVRSVNTI
ncbi:MAG: hypothetical protein ABEK16_03515 [Candidatus Nanohalobium sp.]